MGVPAGISWGARDAIWAVGMCIAPGRWPWSQESVERESTTVRDGGVADRAACTSDTSVSKVSRAVKWAAAAEGGAKVKAEGGTEVGVEAEGGAEREVGVEVEGEVGAEVEREAGAGEGEESWEVGGGKSGSGGM